MAKPKNIYLPIASIVLLLALGVFSAAAFFRSSAWVKVTQSPTASVPTVDEPLENIRFTVYDMGIYPQEIEVTARRLGIVVESRTRVGSDHFVIQRLNENTFQQVARINAVANRLRTRGEVKLSPGRYRVFDQSRPEIYSTLIVSP